MNFRYICTKDIFKYKITDQDIKFIIYIITLYFILFKIGTRIAYSKDALLELSRSPLSKNIPKGLKEIPGVTDKNGSKLENDQKSIKSPIKNDGSDEVFEMDI